MNIEIGIILSDENRDITIIDKKVIKKGKRSRTYYKYKCNSCPNEEWILRDNLLKGTSCNVCKGKKALRGYNDVATVRPDLVKYFVNEEDAYNHTVGSGKKVKLKCPDCGYEKSMLINTLNKRGFSCNSCGDGISYPNKIMYVLLKELKIKSYTEYSPEWVKPKRYDFYLPEHNLIIEMDGAFHCVENKRNARSLEENKNIDLEKDKIAEEHGIKIIRINCNYDNKDKVEFIKNNIIESELNTLFNLNNINWKEINKLALNNLVKEVCLYYKDNDNCSTTVLTKEFNLDKSTIIKYLKQGTKLGWCNYDPKKAKQKSTLLGGKSVSIYKDNEKILSFVSISECFREIKNCLGIEITKYTLSKYCHIEEEYEGYIFKIE